MTDELLHGRVALITGAGTGVGRATALRLAQAGADIVINYSRSEADAESTRARVEALGSRALLWQCDISVDTHVRQMIAATIENFGRLDVLVNNAGVTDFVPMQDLEGLTDVFWDRAFDVNARGVFYCSRAAAPELRKASGVIVNITSMAGICGQGSSIAYAASKAAAICLTQSLAIALAPDVRVNGIAPGIINTRWVEGREEHVEKFGRNTPMGRTAEPEDVAELVYGLICHAPLVTGRNVIIDGGAFL